MTKAWFDLGGGRKVYRSIPKPRETRSDLACPMVIKPFAEPVQSMADGKWYDNPRDLEKTYRPSGNPQGEEYTCLGNDKMKATEYVPDPKERVNDIRQALADVQAGNISPEIEAIQ